MAVFRISFLQGAGETRYVMHQSGNVHSSHAAKLLGQSMGNLLTNF